MTASCRSIMSHYQIKCKRGARAVNFDKGGNRPDL
jgi:hypothetical protein